MAEEQKQVVWQNTLDGRYDIVVERTSDCEGVLKLFDSEKGNEEIFTKEVELSCGAAFGPDMMDIDHWVDLVINFVDDEYNPLPPVDSVE